MQYVVRKGDTLWDIAERFTGDPYKWKMLVGYLDRPLPRNDPRLLQIGTVVTIPDELLPSQSRPAPYPIDLEASEALTAAAFPGYPQSVRRMRLETIPYVSDPLFNERVAEQLSLAEMNVSPATTTQRGVGRWLFPNILGKTPSLLDLVDMMRAPEYLSNRAVIQQAAIEQTANDNVVKQSSPLSQSLLELISNYIRAKKAGVKF